MGLFDFLFGKRRPAGTQPAESAGVSRESADAGLVDSALEQIHSGHPDRAVRILEQVLNRAPANYCHEEERDGKLHARFWDLEDFIAYVGWMQERGTGRDVIWLPNAYPRAAYFLGYLAIEQGAFGRAIEYLDRGLRLQPDSVKLLHEKGQALLRLGQCRDARALYEAALTKDRFIASPDRAVLLRGKGFAEIELGELDAAEATFQESLTLDPESAIARNELDFIATTRRSRV